MIRIIGKDQTYEAITDKNGIYEIYDLPPGEYFLEPEIMKGWKISEYALRDLMLYSEFSDKFDKEYQANRFSVKLSESSDASLDFLLVSNNVIRGKVVDASGQPLKDVFIYAVGIDNPKFTLLHKHAWTNENGQFVITELDRGRYYLVISEDGARPSQPFTTTYFPGVKERSQATMVKIAEGESVVLPDFKVDEILETISLRGKAVYSDGSPIDWENVEFIPDSKDENIKGSYPGEFRNYTERNGSFALRVFKGKPGKIRLEKLFNNEALERCPEIKKAVIEKRNEQTVTVSTE